MHELNVPALRQWTQLDSGFTVCLFAYRCGKNHSGPESVWGLSVIRSGSWRFLHRGGQARRPESRLWCGHSDRREGPPVQNQVAELSSQLNRTTCFPYPFVFTDSPLSHFNLQRCCGCISWQTRMHSWAVCGWLAFIWKPGSPPLPKCKTAFLHSPSSIDHSKHSAPFSPH